MNLKVPCGMDFTNFQDPTHIHAYMPNSIQHLTNFKHSHYNSDAYIDWDLDHISTKHIYRSLLSWVLFWFFRLLGLFGRKVSNLDNIAYLFIWGIEWELEKPIR